MNEPLFKLVDAVLQSNDQNLETESRRFLSKLHWNHTASGLSLPVEQERQRFKAIKARLGELESDFLKSLAEAKSGGGGIWFTREQLEGVPDTVLERFESGQGDKSGLFLVSFSNSDYFAVLRFAMNAATRKRIFLAVDNMCGASVPVFKEAVILRDEAARLLGYPSHAAFIAKENMVQNTETVYKFLGELKDGLLPGVQDELRRLKQLKREHVEANGESFDGRFFIWDHHFYSNFALKKDYAIDHQELAEYFPLNTVVAGILTIFEKLIGFRFSEISTDKSSGQVWHADVQIFSVWDSKEVGGGFVGYLYLDLFRREGKAGHACSFNLIPVSFSCGRKPDLTSILGYPKSIPSHGNSL